MAYRIGTSGAERFTLRVKDLDTGKGVHDVIHETQDRGGWAADDSVLSHTVVDVHGPACQPHRHVICTPEASDAVVYEENNACFFVGASLIPSKIYVVIQTADLVTSEGALIAAAAPCCEPRVVLTRRIGPEYRLNHQRDRFLIKTNDSRSTSLVTTTNHAPSPSPAGRP